MELSRSSTWTGTRIPVPLDAVYRKASTSPGAVQGVGAPFEPNLMTGSEARGLPIRNARASVPGCAEVWLVTKDGGVARPASERVKAAQAM